MRTSKKSKRWEIVATKSVQDLVISIQKKKPERIFMAHHCDLQQKSFSSRWRFQRLTVAILQWVSMAQLSGLTDRMANGVSFDDWSLHGHSYDSYDIHIFSSGSSLPMWGTLSCAFSVALCA